MTAIGPVSNVRPPVGPTSATPSTAKSGPQEKANFSNVIQKYLHSVNTDQAASMQEIQNLLSGKSQDVLPVVTTMAKADMSFKLLIGVRNKVIEAYKQTMNMQI